MTRSRPMTRPPMTRRRVWKRAFLAAAAAWLAAACARPPSPAPSADGPSAAGGPVSADSAARIRLERGPCFGACPVYSVTLDGSGAVLFEGRRFVADTGISTGRVPPARVDSLLAELTAGGYFDFADRYRAGEPGCERYATDLPSVNTEVRAGGRSKRIEHDHGCMDAPQALTTLEGRIDSVAGVARWIRR
jgi:Domain of unknown function (DUF6438)